MSKVYCALEAPFIHNEENPHVTIGFFGDTEVPQEALEVFQAWCMSHEFEGTRDGYNYFGKHHDILVALWKIPGLEEARRELLDDLEPFGLDASQQRNFVPHQSIGQGLAIGRDVMRESILKIGYKFEHAYFKMPDGKRVTFNV